MTKKASTMGTKTRGLAVVAAIWRALRASHNGGPDISSRLRSLPRLAKDTLSGRYRGLSRGRLGLYALAIAYILSPIDLIPEAAFWFLGVADDAAVAAWLAGSLLLDTERYLAWVMTTPPGAGDVIPGEIVR